MSLNELVSSDYKPWLNIRANDVIIDGDLSVRNGLENYVLGYDGNGNVSFGPQLKIINLNVDYYGLIPVQNIFDGTKLNFELGPIAPNNFSINGSLNLVCGTTGIYMLIFKFLEAAETSAITYRPNPYLNINGIAQSTLSLRVPLCNTSFLDSSGSEMTSIFSLTSGDVLSILLATQPAGGTIDMMNSSLASNLILVKIA